MTSNSDFAIICHMNTLYVKNPEFNSATITVAAELRNLIQTWRKENRLPIDFRVPTLNIWYSDEIITTAIREGRTEAKNYTHICELCQVDKVVRYNDEEVIESLKYTGLDIPAICRENDVIVWSNLGGTIKFGSVLFDSLKLVKDASEHHYYEKY